MNSMFSSFPRCVRWLLRVRHRCGYGIHSPFAFNLVTGVVYEEGIYYDYKDLEKLRAVKGRHLRLKDDRLLFRLVNDCFPSHALVIGERLGVTKDYLLAGRKECEWYFLPSGSKKQLDKVVHSTKQVDFVYLDNPEFLEEVMDGVLPYIGGQALLVVRGIHSSPNAGKQWRKVLGNEKVRVSFDLYDFGLLYFESRLNKENYVINYF